MRTKNQRKRGEKGKLEIYSVVTKKSQGRKAKRLLENKRDRSESCL